MPRRGFPSFVAITFVLCLATLALWVRSAGHDEYWLTAPRHSSQPTAAIESAGAGIWMWWEKPPNPRVVYVEPYHWIAIPYGLLALVFFLPTVVWMAQRRGRNQRRRSGLCAACGYDLRATPDRCPECGAKAALTKGAI